MDEKGNRRTVNTKAIRMRMVDKELTSAELADVVGVSPSKMSFILNNKQDMKLWEAFEIQQALDIPDERFTYYFLDGGQQKGTEDDNQPTEPASTAR